MELPFIAATMARRGLLKPGSPVRIARQFDQLRRWGFSLAGELRQAAVRSPGRAAVVDEDGVTTYRQLLERAEKLALALPAGTGDRVGILCRNSAAMIETMAGVSLLGADPVLMNTGLSAPQLAAIAKDQNLRACVYDDEFAPAVADVPVALVAASSLAALITAAPSRPLRPPARTGHTIVLTSGTTGVPKGARRRTPTGFGPLCSVIDRIPVRAGARVMIAAPLFHTWGYAGMQIALALRATMVLRRRFVPADTLRTMVDQACDTLFAVPVMLQGLLEVPELRPPLQVVAVSGSALPGGLATRFMDRFGDVLYNMYGSTEVSWASIATPADLRADPNTAGRPPHGTAIGILDPAGKPVARGTSGRIFIGNAMLFEGYTAGATAKEARDGMIATGDVGHLDENGRVFVDGREDDMIVSGGENVFPSEVENLLADLPEIREVAVIGVPDDTYGQRLAAFVVLHDGSALDPDFVREHVRRNRARFCVPRDITFLDVLPRNATGKVLARELRG